MGSVPKNKVWKYISFMGDSLTNNDSLLIQKTDMVPYQVEKSVGGNCKSINKGVSGNTTTQVTRTNNLPFCDYHVSLINRLQFCNELYCMECAFENYIRCTRMDNSFTKLMMNIYHSYEPHG
jgi:hypothetical protein